MNKETPRYSGTIRQKIRHLLFPGVAVPPPILSECKANDSLRIHTTVDLDFRDRLRALFGGRIILVTETATEHAVGRTKTEDAFYVTTKRGA